MAGLLDLGGGVGGVASLEQGLFFLGGLLGGESVHLLGSSGTGLALGVGKAGLFSTGGLGTGTGWLRKASLAWLAVVGAGPGLGDLFLGLDTTVAALGEGISMEDTLTRPMDISPDDLVELMDLDLVILDTVEEAPDGEKPFSGGLDGDLRSFLCSHSLSDEEAGP